MKHIHTSFIVVFMIVMTLATVAESAVCADDTFTIPDYITSDEEFYLCSIIPSNVNCTSGTENLSYSYGSSIGELTREEIYLNATKNIYCTELVSEDYSEDYPEDSVEILLYNTGYCDIDGTMYPITVLAVAQTNEAQLSINGVVGWYGLDNYYEIDNTTNARFTLENIRETHLTTYVNISCDSNKIIEYTYTEVIINGTCDDLYIVDVLEWQDTKVLDIGEVYINYISNLLEGDIRGNVSETLMFKINILDENESVVNGDINYAVRNYTGEILVKADMTYNSEESAYVANYMFDENAPYGFVEFNAYSTSIGYGGSKFYFITEPYILNLTIDGSNETNFSYFLNDQIPINISYDNYYGEIISINTTMEIRYDNDSVDTIDIPINMTDMFYVYNVPGNAPGNYTLETTVYHSIGESKTYKKYIRVEGFYLMINTDPVWEAGDNITFSAWVEDRRGGSPVLVPCNATFTLSTPTSQNIGLDSISTSEYKEKAYYSTANTTQMGFYVIKVNAIDTYDNSYTGEYTFSIGGVYANQYIEVYVPEAFTIVQTGNYTVSINIQNIKGQKIYNLEAYKDDNDTDYIYVNISEDGVDINASEEIYLDIIITPDALENDEYEEIIIINVGSDTIEMPLMFYIDINPELEIINRNFDNSSFEITMFKNIAWQESITIKNVGYRDMEIPSIHFIGDEMIENVTTIQPSDNVSVNASVSVLVTFNYDTIGNYSGTLHISAPNMVDQTYNITIYVLEGLSTQVTSLSDELSLTKNWRNMLELNASINKVNLNFSTVNEMIINATDLRSYILSKYGDPANYETIMDNITEFESMLSDIDDELTDIEKSYTLLTTPKAGDGKCDPSEPCTIDDCKYKDRCTSANRTEVTKAVCGDSICDIDDGECDTCPEDCPKQACEAMLNPPVDDDGGSGSILWIIIIVVMIVVIGVILATSLVSVDDGEKKKTGASAGKDNIVINN